MSLSLLPTLADSMLSEYLTPFLDETYRLPCGRPSCVDRDIKRNKQIRFTGLVIVEALSVNEAARANDVDRRTILNWRKTLLADNQPDTDHLRTLAAVRRRKHRRGPIEA